MECGTFYYYKEDYIETLTGNRVSRKSVLCGSQNIRLAGKTLIKPSTIIRGDLANVNIGRYCTLGERSVIRPSYKRFKGGIAFFPVTIGDYVEIGEDCLISAATIGSFVKVGRNCVISKRCIIKDCCEIEDGTVLPPDTVVPPFTKFGGCPGRLAGSELPATTLLRMQSSAHQVSEDGIPFSAGWELSESFEEIMKQKCISMYESMAILTKT